MPDIKLRHDPRSRWEPPLEGGEICVYCGEPAKAVDHLFPFKEFGNDTPMVPACKECNSIASAKVFQGFTEKRDHIQARLMQKYQKILKCVFDDLELTEFSGRLKDFVMQGIKQRAIILQRISFDEHPVYIYNWRYTGWADG